MSYEAGQYITENGLVLRLKAVRPVLLQQGLMALEEEWRKRGEAVDTPTYTVTNVAGDSDTFPLDEKALDIPGDEERTRLNHAKWDRYLACQQRLNAAKGERQQILLLALGVEFDMPEDESWRQVREWIGVKIPTNALDLKVHYLTTVAMTQYDLMMVTSQLEVLSAGKMVKPDQVEQFQGALRRAVEEQAGRAVDRALEAIGALVDRAEVDGDSGGNQERPST